jgi:hypothetical protein
MRICLCEAACLRATLSAPESTGSVGAQHMCYLHTLTTWCCSRRPHSAIPNCARRFGRSTKKGKGTYVATKCFSVRRAGLGANTQLAKKAFCARGACCYHCCSRSFVAAGGLGHLSQEFRLLSEWRRWRSSRPAASGSRRRRATACARSVRGASGTGSTTSRCSLGWWT